jgi:hypothetical protein
MSKSHFSASRAVRPGRNSNLAGSRMIHWCCSIVDSAAARSTPARGARRFRQSPTFSNRSMSSICPDRIFDRALSKSNHSVRSTSGKDWRRPLLGGHSISKVLLDSDAVSKSASPQKATTRLPPR